MVRIHMEMLGLSLINDKEIGGYTYLVEFK